MGGDLMMRRAGRGPAAPLRGNSDSDREDSPAEKATAAKAIADNVDRYQHLASEGVAQMRAAAAVDDRATWHAAKKKAETAVAQLRDMQRTAIAAMEHAGDSRTSDRLAAVTAVVANATALLGQAPLLPEPKLPVLSCANELLAALPPDSPVADAHRVFTTAERALADVFRNVMTASDITAFLTIVRDHPETEIGRRFHRLGGERRKRLLELLKDAKVRARARARASALRDAIAPQVDPTALRCEFDIDPDANEPITDGASDTSVEEAQVSPDAITDDRCDPRGVVHETALAGVHLMIQAPPLPKYDQILDSQTVGPHEVGPYRFQPHTMNRQVVYYVAFHKQRHQQEWAIGPDSIDYFVHSIDLFIGAARAAYPGSRNVPDSQADGADQVQHPPSMLELEAFGQAPWQRQFGGGSLADAAEATPESGIASEDANLFTLDLHEGHEHRAAADLVSHRNGEIRLDDYEKEAKRLASELTQDLDTGADHLAVREEAVKGRNHIMTEVREKLSPSAAYASRQLKSDRAITVDRMTSKKVPDILDAASGATKTARTAMQGVLGLKGDAAALRAYLAEDSELWAEYLARLQSGNDARLLYADAVQRLGEQPAVSRAIVHSAGRTNRFVTWVARRSRWPHRVSAGLSLYHAVRTVADAKEGERLHAAAGELAGFTGGVIGAEAGAASAVWMASLLMSGPSAPAIMIISLLGGALGGAIGAEIAPNMFSVWGAALNAGGQAVLGPGMPQSGGYGGLYDRSMRSGAVAYDVEEQLADAIFARDQELQQVEDRIVSAESRKVLRALWAQRLAIIDDRDALGSIYGALKLGSVGQDEVWNMMGGMRPGERAR
jgi:hypothetical protein